MINTLTNSLDYNYTILECELKKALYPLYQEKLCDNFLEKISDKLENFCLTANYTDTGICISLKIKKTNMKKIYSDYSHNSLYYYRIMNEILLSVYRDNYNYIMSNLNDQLKEVFINLINNSIESLYTIVTLSDNVINILL